ncbi:MAG: hypothetical protein PQJ59_16465 [Spirochaetales bacterium]|nr:hypothetical protein [Spirochaetales bacterium]
MTKTNGEKYLAIVSWLRERYTEDGYIYTVKNGEPTTFAKLEKAFFLKYNKE